MPVKKKKVLVTVYSCLRCGAEWLPRKPLEPIDLDSLPRRCAECNTDLWNTPRERQLDEASKARKRSRSK